MNRKALSGFGAVALLAAVVLLMGAQSQQPEQWLHIRVDDTKADGEMVKVNLPMSVAEKVLPAIRAHKLSEGKIRLGELRIHRVIERLSEEQAYSLSGTRRRSIGNRISHKPVTDYCGFR